MNTLIAYDYSGSTEHCTYYHNETQNIVSKIDNPRILLWDNQVSECTLTELKRINQKRAGRGGTAPSGVAKWIVQNKFNGRLIFITDGEISLGEVEKTSEILRDWKFEFVTCHLLQKGREANISVTCPFTKNSPHAVYFNGVVQGGITQKEIEMCSNLEKISTLKEFEDIYKILETFVTAKTVGTKGDIELRNSLLKLKERLVWNISKEQKQDFTERLRTHLGADDVKGALKVSQDMIQNHLELHGPSDWSKKLSRLISMTEGSIRDTFGQTAINNRLDRADMVEQKDSRDVHVEEEYSFAPQFICPISYEEENNIILLVTEGKPILPNLEKWMMDDIVNCPLNALKYPLVMKQLSERLDHAIGLKSFQQYARISPFTRVPVIGGLVLGANKEHVEASNWILAKICADGKSCGNLDLWFAVFWKLAQKKDYLQELLPVIERQLKWRLQNVKTFASLTGLPEYVNARIGLDCALWFILSSPFVDLASTADPLRAHVPHLDSLKEVFHLTGYKLPQGADLYHRRTEALLMLLRLSKKDGLFSIFNNRIEALYQRAIQVDEKCIDEKVKERETLYPYILIDGEAPQSQTAEVLRSKAFARLPEISVEEIVGLARMIKPCCNASSITLPLDWTPGPLPKASVNWAYGLGELKQVHVEICGFTCRPYSTIGDKEWQVVAEEKFNIPHERMLSIHRAFGDFVTKYKKYPTNEEFILFLFNHEKNQGTLPAQIIHMVKRTFKEFETVCREDTPAEFSRSFQGSVSRRERRYIESHEQMLNRCRAERASKSDQT